MKRVTYDIETLINCSTFTFKNYDTGEVAQFVFYAERNDWLPLQEYWKSITHLINFNGNHFDNPVTQWVMQQPGLGYLSGSTAAGSIYQRAQQVITQGDTPEMRAEVYQYQREAHFISIDLFLYWSRMLRLSKKLSLKSFAHNLGMSIIEMPIHHAQQVLTQTELQQVLDYNLQDVEVTHALALELREQINLRGWIQKTYKLPCWSKDAPKIAQELILKSYCERTRRNKRELSKRRYIKPTPLALKPWIPDVVFATSFFQQVHQDMQNSVDTFKQEYKYRNPDGSIVKLSYGIGGLHSLNSNEKWETTTDQLVITSDVASLYPQLIINHGYVSPELGIELLHVYENIKAERLIAKRTGDKQKDALLKLCLNGFSGLCDAATCWLYAPEQILMMRMHGQLLLSKLIEKCGLSGINIISANTDGIEVRLHPSQQEIYKQVLSEIEAEFSVQFESDQYRVIYYKTVNDYLAITTSGKVKEKGELVSEKVIDASNEFLVIPKAIRAYFEKGESPDQFIRNHREVFDFCAAKKIDKNYTVYYKGGKQQQLNRYLVATRDQGAYLYKQKHTKPGVFENVLKGTPVVLVNEACTKPATDYPVDYEFYIGKAWETISLFQPKQLSLF